MKKILFTLCLAAALTGARGQIYIDSYRFGAAVSDDLLLDSFPTAELALSLRKLDKDYTGNCITIQKDNGDTSNVAFSGNYLDTAAVKTFCGTGAGDSCRVRVWFDQSGNARNPRQNTAASQPLIMINGALNYENGEIVLNFRAAMEIPSSQSSFNFLHNQSGNGTIFTIAKFGNTSDPNTFSFLLDNSQGSGSNVGITIFYDDRSSVSRNNSHNISIARGFSGTENLTVNFTENNRIAANQIQLVYSRVNPNNATAANRAKGAINGGAEYGNNTNALTASNNNATYNLSVGGDLFFGQELIIYAADKSSDKSAIEGNINRFYSIY